jgi:hypothetical protein
MAARCGFVLYTRRLHPLFARFSDRGSPDPGHPGAATNRLSEQRRNIVFTEIVAIGAFNAGADWLLGLRYGSEVYKICA